MTMKNISCSILYLYKVIKKYRKFCSVNGPNKNETNSNNCGCNNQGDI